VNSTSRLAVSEKWEVTWHSHNHHPRLAWNEYSRMAGDISELKNMSGSRAINTPVQPF